MTKCLKSWLHTIAQFELYSVEDREEINTRLINIINDGDTPYEYIYLMTKLVYLGTEVFGSTGFRFSGYNIHCGNSQIEILYLKSRK